MTETEIRKALIAKLATSRAGVGAAFISEMFLSQFSRRADLVMANGKLSAFEIKSPSDSLDRLDGQLETYLRYFEAVTIVCAERHVNAVIGRVPLCVGIWSVDNQGQFTVVRRAQIQKIDCKDSWLSFLPVDELKFFLGAEGLRKSGDRPTLVSIANQLSLSLIREYVLSYLKRRNQRVANLVSKRQQTLIHVSPPNSDNRMERLELFIKQHVTSATSATATPRRRVA
jgi:hypothetical protein